MSYDTLKFSVLQHIKGEFGLAAELLEGGKRGYYCEFQRKFPDYRTALEYAQSRMKAFQKKIDSLEFGINVVCDRVLGKSEQLKKILRSQHPSSRPRPLSATPAGLTAISIARLIRQRKRVSRTLRLARLQQFRGAIRGFSR